MRITIFVAEENGMIVGYISWEIKGGFARAVPVNWSNWRCPDYRGQGIGRERLREPLRQ